MSATILDKALLHDGWNRLLMVRVRMASGTVIDRSVEDHGEAVTVLPFDPQRRVAILVRQLRVPLLTRFDIQSSLEAPAGILDEENPEVCARREAMEEAGIQLSALVSLGRQFAMPGISTERMHLFLAEYSQTDHVAAGGGLAEENEEIEVLEIALSELASMADSGALSDMKTFALVQSLRLKRPELF